jgi:hypothetical protein
MRLLNGLFCRLSIVGVYLMANRTPSVMDRPCGLWKRGPNLGTIKEGGKFTLSPALYLQSFARAILA